MSDVNVASGVNIRLLTVKTRQIQAIECTANTETIVFVPAGTKRYAIKTRGNSDMQVAFVTGEVGTPDGDYLTYWAGSLYEETNLDPLSGGFNLYIQLSTTDYVELSLYA